MPELAGDDLRLSCEEILKSYSRVELRRLLFAHFTWELEWLVRDAGLNEQVVELFQVFGRQKMSGRLLHAAATGPPPRAALALLARKYPSESSAPATLAELVAGTIAGFRAIPVEEAEVRARLGPFVNAYQDAVTGIELLRRYKTLHDGLHVIQLQSAEIGRASATVTDELGAADLTVYADRLDDVLHEVEPAAAGVRSAPLEATWLAGLRRAVELLRVAVAERDPSHSAEAVLRLDRILKREPGRIHREILDLSRTIPLPALLDSLGVLRELPGNGWHAPINEGLTALETLKIRLASLVAEHTAWQNLDNALRLALESWEQFVASRRRAALMFDGGMDAGQERDQAAGNLAQRLLDDWPKVWDTFVDVRGRAALHRRLEQLVRYAERLQEAAASGNWGGALETFEPFARLALQRFADADKELLRLAIELTSIGEPLRAVLEVIRHD